MQEFTRTRGHHAGAGFYSSAMTRIVIFTLCMFNMAAVLAHGEALSSKKDKKPRFEQTEKTVRDRLKQLEWASDIDPLLVSWYRAFEYVDLLNKNRYAGCRDWRFPTREELLTLVEYAASAGSGLASAENTIPRNLRRIGFTKLRDDGYWSLTSYIYDDSLAWVVNFENGMPETVDKTLYHYVIAVRTMSTNGK